MLVTDITRLKKGDKNEQVKLLCEEVLGYTYYNTYVDYLKDYEREEVVYPVVYSILNKGKASWECILDDYHDEEEFNPFENDTTAQNILEEFEGWTIQKLASLRYTVTIYGKNGDVTVIPEGIYSLAKTISYCVLLFLEQAISLADTDPQA